MRFKRKSKNIMAARTPKGTRMSEYTFVGYYVDTDEVVVDHVAADSMAEAIVTFFSGDSSRKEFCQLVAVFTGYHVDALSSITGGCDGLLGYAELKKQLRRLSKLSQCKSNCGKCKAAKRGKTRPSFSDRSRKLS